MIPHLYNLEFEDTSIDIRYSRISTICWALYSLVFFLLYPLAVTTVPGSSINHTNESAQILTLYHIGQELLSSAHGWKQK